LARIEGAAPASIVDQARKLVDILQGLKERDRSPDSMRRLRWCR
jgi:hypothetical protein